MSSFNNNSSYHQSSNVVMMPRKDLHHHHHHATRNGINTNSNSSDTTGLVAMLSSTGLRGPASLDHSSTQVQLPLSTKRPLYATMLESLDESGDGEVADDGSTGGGSGGGGGGGGGEKKRRLSTDQVRSLETSFETENRLEPVRKMQLAQELGLQPRQVAVWFQNRRARWKTKQLERDYDLLRAAYDSLLEENTKLKVQLEKLASSDNDETTSGLLKKHVEEVEESGADKVNLVQVNKSTKANNNKSSGLVEEDEACNTPDSPTVVSSKLKESYSPSPDGYGSEVLDGFGSPHATTITTTTTTTTTTLTAKSPLGPRNIEASRPSTSASVNVLVASQSIIKEEPMTFPYKLDEDETLRGLDSEASYTCLFGVSPEEEQGNWAWWDWS